MAIQPVSFRLYDWSFDEFADALGGSFQRYGFAVVADHGLEPAMVAGALAGAKTFFALPEAAKRRYRIAGGAGQRGYTPFAVETAKGAAHADLKEFWHVGAYRIHLRPHGVRSAPVRRRPTGARGARHPPG
ncbi:MAG TPA: 2-oxoglutarate and iron-dependent oxygenase domain-containing protein, partial [Caulobacteraceae bacterium]|nr:2-oxoglutarate and iron-dependent oxygenase domain-containing protein [Caulobacteraceae bacterium]